MKDGEFNREVEEVRKIIKELEEGEASLEEGGKLKEKGLKVLESLKDLLNMGEGKTIILRDRGDEVLEKELKL